ncbi:MAG TPA: TonB family protein [Acidobacteriaceae bacterium]|nr:TonB family protein [Acidobacteriaceae bacterium]
MFSQLIVSGKSAPSPRRSWSVLVSVALQALLIGTMILIPLIYTEALPKAMLSTFIVAPAPPPPPPPPMAAVKVKQVKLAQVIETNPVTPTVIPKKIEVEKDQAAPDVASNTQDNGMPGGTGDVLGGIAGNGPVVPPPPKPQAPRRITLGGQVQAAKLINKVPPQYPEVARSAHVTGTVVLRAVVSKSGGIEQLQLVSGPPLLAKAAMDAVTQWRYRPTVLNGQPVEVDTTISVVFSLG